MSITPSTPKKSNAPLNSISPHRVAQNSARKAVEPADGGGRIVAELKRRACDSPSGSVRPKKPRSDSPDETSLLEEHQITLCTLEDYRMPIPFVAMSGEQLRRHLAAETSRKASLPPTKDIDDAEWSAILSGKPYREKELAEEAAPENAGNMDVDMQGL